MGEYFRDYVCYVLIVYDDLSKYVVVYREIFLILRRFLGREVFFGDVFYIYLWFLERVVKFCDEKGVGFLIAFFIVEI